MNFDKIRIGILKLIKEAETKLPDDVINSLKKAHNKEDGLAKIQLETIIKNVEIAQKNQVPICQDTGTQSFFIEAGSNFPNLSRIISLINEAVKEATIEIPIRPNAIDIISEKNSGDNTGDFIPHINWQMVKGNNLKITAFPRGGGSENMSKLHIFNPKDSMDIIMEFIVDWVVNIGGKACPPFVVGVCIGGISDLTLNVAKKSLLRKIGKRNDDKDIAKMEKELIKKINSSGVGPMGLGGKTTVLDVHVEKAHRHPASLPVGIAVSCWANRRATMILRPDGSWEIQ